MAKHRHECLRTWIYASALPTEDDAFAGLNLLFRRELVKDALIYTEIETRIATINGMTDPISLSPIEE